jgi:hypothetical protein
LEMGMCSYIKRQMTRVSLCINSSRDIFWVGSGFPMATATASQGETQKREQWGKKKKRKKDQGESCDFGIVVFRQPALRHIQRSLYDPVSPSPSPPLT